jgi:hypothetical protein
MHLITARASDAVVIAENSAEHQCEVKGIPISLPLLSFAKVMEKPMVPQWPS